MKELKFKVGDKVNVHFMDGMDFTIKEIIEYKNPHNISDKQIFYNILVENEFKKFKVTPLEIEWCKSHTRDLKLKELGIKG